MIKCGNTLDTIGRKYNYRTQTYDNLNGPMFCPTYFFWTSIRSFRSSRLCFFFDSGFTVSKNVPKKIFWDKFPKKKRLGSLKNTKKCAIVSFRRKNVQFKKFGIQELKKYAKEKKHTVEGRCGWNLGFG